jgi:hypothetical protein
MFAFFACHSREGGNLLWLGRWIPAIVYPHAVGGRPCPHEGGCMTTSPVAGFLQTCGIKKSPHLSKAIGGFSLNLVPALLDRLYWPNQINNT